MRTHMRGFTLIEILVVVTILAIAATVAVPAVSNGYDNIRVPSAARMVMSDILYAQNSAVTRQQKVYIYFASDLSGYTIAYFPGETGAQDATSTYNATKTDFDGSITVGGKAGTVLTQPTTQTRYMVQFGPNGGDNAPGPLSRTLLTSVKAGSTEIKSIGFDSLGQPLKADGTPVLETIELTFTNLRTPADVTQKLEISPITGEINVPK